MIKIFFKEIGSYSIFVLSILVTLPMLRKRFHETIRQMKRIGVDSLLLISVTSAFTGLVTAVQASYQTKGYIPESLISVMIGKSIMIELAPVLTALVLSGKVGAAISAEIGTMKVTEQLDALEAMAINTFDFLYLPRLVAGVVMIVMLTIYANIIGIFSGFVISHFSYNITAHTFFVNMKNYFLPSDLWGGLVKSFLFAFFIITIACYSGHNAKGGAEGVGKAATLTVVYSSILILLSDFSIAILLFGGV